MDMSLIEMLLKWGLGGAALGMFYILTQNERKENRIDRKEENEKWRKITDERSEKTDKVIKELADVIRDISNK